MLLGTTRTFGAKGTGLCEAGELKVQMFNYLPNLMSSTNVQFGRNALNIAIPMLAAEFLVHP